MPKNKGETVAQAIQLPAEVEQELSLLKGFRDLVNEGIGYYLGAKATQSEASEKTKEQRKAASDIRKSMSEQLEQIITNADIKTYKETMEKLKTARKALAEAMKPFNEKKSPLNRAWKYCVNVAFPDSLKELGAPVSPRFSLSDWIAEATKPKKK